MFKKLLKTTALLGAASSIVYASKKYKEAPCYLGRRLCERKSRYHSR